MQRPRYNEGISVNEFAVYKTGEQSSYYYRTQVTSHTCVPISEMLLHSLPDKTIVSELSSLRDYSDVILGIANPEYFIPPAICFTPPPPPPPPAPGVKCKDALTSLCGRVRIPSEECIKCCDANEAVLQKDGCKYADIDAFCNPSDL